MFTEKIKKNILIILVIFITAFLLFNFRVFVIAPAVDLKGFEDLDILAVNDNKYILTGKAVGSKNFYINNREILLNIDSTFSETLYLSDYQNNFYIRSVSKTGTIFERTIQIYKQ